MIPEGWQKVSLHTIAYIQTGVAKGGKSPRNPVELPYLRVANVQDGHLNLSEIKTLEIDITEVSRYLLQEGDVLLTEGGDFDKLGRGTVWQGEIKRCIHQNHVFAVRLDPDHIIPNFFAAQIASSYGKRYFLSCAKRSTNLASVNKTQLSEYPVLLPPLAEQRKIAAILGVWDKAIATTEQLIVALRARKRALMQRLLTGEVRFPGFEGEWEEVKLGNIASMEGGGTPSTQEKSYWEGSIPWITGADFQENLQLSSIRRYISEEAVKNSSTTVVPKGDILLVSRTGVGKLAMAHFDVAISQDITRLSTNGKYVDNRYLLFSLHNSLSQLARFNQGTSINGVTRKDLKDLAIKLPRLVEQRQIAHIIDIQMTQIEQQLRYCEHLRQQKRGLMQRLLTGQVRVAVTADQSPS